MPKYKIHHNHNHIPMHPCMAAIKIQTLILFCPCTCICSTNSMHMPLQPCAAYVFDQAQSQHISPLQDQPNTNDTGGHIYDEVNDNVAWSGRHLHRRIVSSNTAILNDMHDESDDSGEYALADGGLDGDTQSLVREHDTDVGSELEDSVEESYVEPINASQLNAPYRVTVYSKNEGSFPLKVHNGGAVTEGYLTVIQS